MQESFGMVGNEDGFVFLTDGGVERDVVFVFIEDCCFDALRAFFG